MGKLNRRRIPDSPNHWDRINLNPDKCFVCDKALGKKRSIFIGKKNGVVLKRHESCDSISENWKRKFSGCTTLP
jgi:hypothetical protein